MVHEVQVDGQPIGVLKQTFQLHFIIFEEFLALLKNNKLGARTLAQKFSKKEKGGAWGFAVPRFRGAWGSSQGHGSPPEQEKKNLATQIILNCLRRRQAKKLCST